VGGIEAPWEILDVEVPAVDRGAYHAAKRAVDLILGTAMLILTLPLFLLIAIAIELDSPGPVIFAQERVRGRRVRSRSDGSTSWVFQRFTLYKFRTMVANADPTIHKEYMTAYLASDHERLAALRPDRADGESFRPAEDPRVTRVGRILRKLSLDELPQLWNVIRGDMSLVGPRPPVPYEVELYDTHDLRRLGSLPGITGWAQTHGRCSIEFDEMVRLDLEYIERQSIWLDLKILLITVPLVLSRKGAD
jgi:lipopolysaccharide/colanic/teichoic acid biosynthesis glycosyltransferase